MKYISLKIAAAITLLSLILTPSVSNAQATFGVKGGLNFTNLSVENLPNKREKIGFNVGVFSDINLINNFLAFQPEISFSTQGTTYKVGDQSRNIGLNYTNLHVPIAFRLSNFDLQLGPFMSYLISAKDYKSFDESQIALDAFNRIDVGVSGGINVNVSKLVIGLRYNQGLMNVTKDNAKPFIGTGKNIVGQLTVGYKF